MASSAWFGVLLMCGPADACLVVEMQQRYQTRAECVAALEEFVQAWPGIDARMRGCAKKV